MRPCGLTARLLLMDVTLQVDHVHWLQMAPRPLSLSFHGAKVNIRKCDFLKAKMIFLS
jgi:hypothetical protein